MMNNQYAKYQVQMYSKAGGVLPKVPFYHAIFAYMSVIHCQTLNQRKVLVWTSPWHLEVVSMLMRSTIQLIL